MSGKREFEPGKLEDREEGQFLSTSPYLQHASFQHKGKGKKVTGTTLERAIDERDQAQRYLSMLQTRLQSQEAKLEEEAHREEQLQADLTKKRGLNEYQMAFLLIQNAMAAIIKTCRGK